MARRNEIDRVIAKTVGIRVLVEGLNVCFGNEFTHPVRVVAWLEANSRIVARNTEIGEESAIARSDFCKPTTAKPVPFDKPVREAGSPRRELGRVMKCVVVVLLVVHLTRVKRSVPDVARVRAQRRGHLCLRTGDGCILGCPKQSDVYRQDATCRTSSRCRQAGRRCRPRRRRRVEDHRSRWSAGSERMGRPRARPRSVPCGEVNGGWRAGL
jgi:hypothetical protein